jgi:hypothetical protein
MKADAASARCRSSSPGMLQRAMMGAKEKAAGQLTKALLQRVFLTSPDWRGMICGNSRGGMRLYRRGRAPR